MTSSSGTRKEGIRCDGIIKEGRRKDEICGALLLAKDSPAGPLTMRCSRPQCREPHSILVLLSKAMEKGDISKEEMLQCLDFKNQLSEEGTMKTTMKVYVLHLDKDDYRVKGVVLARSPREAASILGGEYIEPEDGIKQSSTDPEELTFRGWIRFAPELFREMTSIEKQVAGLFAGRRCYTRGCFTLLSNMNGGPVDLVIREYAVLLPEYISTPFD